jgi:hypothetical protein
MDLLEAKNSDGVWFRLARGLVFVLVVFAFGLMFLSLSQQPASGSSGGNAAAKHSSADPMYGLSTAG